MDLNQDERVLNSNTITDDERDAFMNRFKKACRKRGMSVAYIQSRMGKANAYFRNMGFISPKMAPEVRKYIPDLNIEYVNTGVGDMFLSQRDMDAEPLSGGYLVPLIPLSAKGGSLGGYADGVRREECELVVSPMKDAKLAITVSGDSMSPEYPSGCMVFIKKVDEQAFLEWGKAYVLDTCNGVIIKKIFPSQDSEDEIICHSVNSDYPDFKIRLSSIYGFYKVLLQLSLK